MKVISGKYKGRNILGHVLNNTRPTMDRVKESLFATIQNSIDNAVVLDLFAGSGALGIEALSMGAKSVYFIDKDSDAIKIINKNIENIKIDDEVHIIKSDYKLFLKTTDTKFDIIFLDPPYNTDYINIALDIINTNAILTDNGIIVCETNDLTKLITNDFNTVKSKKYGDKYIVILKKIL